MNNRGRMTKAALMGFSSLVLLGGLVTRGAEASWETIGPPGGAIRALADNERQTSELFAVTASSFAQVYKSTDSAQSWQRVAGFSEPLYDIAVDGEDPAIIYALGASSVKKTDDGGGTWRTIFLPTGFSGLAGRLVVVRGRAGTVYIAGRTTQLAVVKSKDYGETWALCGSGISETFGDALCAAVDPKNPDNIYLCGCSNASCRVYWTSDGGQSWAGTILSPDANPYDIAVDPFDSSKVLVATSAGIYRTTDAGQSWSHVSLVSLYRLCADATTPGAFYAAYQKSAYKSMNGGLDWAGHYDPILGSCSSLRLKGGVLYLGSELGVFSSPVTAWNWQERCTALNAREIIKITLSGASPNMMYAVDKNGCFFKSTDFGDSWAVATNIFQGHSLSALMMSPSDIPYVYASSFSIIRCEGG